MFAQGIQHALRILTASFEISQPMSLQNIHPALLNPRALAETPMLTRTLGRLFDSRFTQFQLPKSSLHPWALSSSKSPPSTYYASTKANAHAHDLLNLTYESTWVRYTVSQQKSREDPSRIKIPFCTWSMIWTMLWIIPGWQLFSQGMWRTSRWRHAPQLVVLCPGALATTSSKGLGSSGSSNDINTMILMTKACGTNSNSRNYKSNLITTAVAVSNSTSTCVSASTGTTLSH